jgi:pyruvate kinase
MAREGDIVVFSTGVPVGASGDTNMIKVVKVGRAG